ncbi:MAG: prepilin peptidase [Pseudomonadales bacterium]|nr:prepilin peptidase [Pseudomonadales bacterium]
MTEYLAALQAAYPILVYAIVLMFGMIFGSFLNVVIHRLPVMMERDWQAQAREVLGQEPSLATEPYNLVVPRSACPGCGRQIKAIENIPVVSYLFLRGRCAGCGMHISARYPAVELATGILFVLVVAKLGLTPAGLAGVTLTFALIGASMIDYDHQLIPDDISLPLMWLGLIVNYFDVIVGFRDAFWGAVAGYLCLWTVYQAFKLVTGKEGMGYGDFKLLAALGAFMGWQMLPLIVILSSFVGAIIGGALIVFGRDRSHPIPFGPYLAIAGFIALLWGHELTTTWLQFTAVK